MEDKDPTQLPILPNRKPGENMNILDNSNSPFTPSPGQLFSPNYNGFRANNGLQKKERFPWEVTKRPTDPGSSKGFILVTVVIL